MYLLENPVLQRELLVNLRMTRAFLLLFFYNFALGIVVYLGFWILAAAFAWNTVLHMALSGIAFVVMGVALRFETPLRDPSRRGIKLLLRATGVVGYTAKGALVAVVGGAIVGNDPDIQLELACNLDEPIGQRDQVLRFAEQGVGGRQPPMLSWCDPC